MYDYAVFDLDGTLLDTLPALAAAGNLVCREHGWPERPAREYRPFIGGSLAAFVSGMMPPASSPTYRGPVPAFLTSPPPFPWTCFWKSSAQGIRDMLFWWETARWTFKPPGRRAVPAAA